MALAVVMIVSLVALGLRVGIIVAASVPLTLAAVFVIMLASGRDFDRITLGALILSVLNSMLTFLNVGQAIQQVVYGAIVLALAWGYSTLTRKT